MFSLWIHLDHRLEPKVVKNVLCGFPSSGHLFLQVGLVLACKTVRRMPFVKWGGQEGLVQYQGCTQYHDWWESRVSYDDTLCPHDTSLTPNRDATGNLIF